ncbi:MAG: UDP-4-amino-4,6-dideoxy-N-acetyl-beta-L-altrosamine transaminase [Verrucomicrobiota bacterium]
MLPYGRQTLDDDDIAAVVRVLRSDFLTCGPDVEAFEREFAEFVGAKHAVAVCNATAALHLAMLVADIGPGDRVVTSPNTFLASANCAAYVGATPDFCDIDPVSYNLDPGLLEASWQPDTKAVVAVDYAGQPCDMPAISRIARANGAVVIEDACHGTGGGFFHNGKDWKLGGHPWADLTVFSFHPVKTLTTGEGGMLVTDNDEYARRARLLRTHGIERDPSRFLSPVPCPLSPVSCPTSPGPWYYEMHELGYNYRITDIQCALGRSQLTKLPHFIQRRQQIVAHYNEALADLPWLTTPGLRPPSSVLCPLSSDLRPPTSDLCPPISWHLYTIQLDFLALGRTRTEVMAALRQQGVGTQVLYIPVHLQPWYRKTYGYAPGKCPNAEAFYTQALSLPLYPALTDDDVQDVIHAVRALA